MPLGCLRYLHRLVNFICVYESISGFMGIFFYIWPAILWTFHIRAGTMVVRKGYKKSGERGGSVCDRLTWKWRHQVPLERPLLISFKKAQHRSSFFIFSRLSVALYTDNSKMSGWECWGRRVDLLKDLIGGHICFLPAGYLPWMYLYISAKQPTLRRWSRVWRVMNTLSSPMSTWAFPCMWSRASN